MFFQTYLKEFAFGNAVYTDLWRHLQMVGAPLQKIPVWWSMSEGQCLNISWYCLCFSLHRQWIRLELLCLTLWRTSWTPGFCRWVFLWSPLTPPPVKSVSNTSSWTQTPTSPPRPTISKNVDFLVKQGTRSVLQDQSSPDPLWTGEDMSKCW